MSKGAPTGRIDKATAPPIRLLGEGQSAHVYLMPGERVLKLFRQGVPREQLKRELTVARHAHAAGLPVARFHKRRDHDGRQGLLFDLVKGETLLADMLRRPTASFAALGRLARLHAHLHSVAAPPELPELHGVVARQIERSTAPESWRARALAALAALPSGDRLLHGDLHPGNVIRRDDELVVIDWSKATRGPAAADVARSELVYRFAHLGGLGRARPFHGAARDLLGAWYVSRYARASGVSRRSIRAWRLPLAVAWYDGRRSGREAAYRGWLERLAARPG